MVAHRYLWSTPSPTRIAAAAVPAILDWCRSRRVGRPMLVGGPSLTATPDGLARVHALEAAGLAVWAFDRAVAPTVAAVGEAVAGYHFEGCDAVVAIGGGAAVEIAKGAALMVGQRNPYRALAPSPGADGEPVDASVIAPFLAVPATPAAALAGGAALWIVDEVGIARPLRHPALRPGEAVLATDVVAAVPGPVRTRSAAVAALIAADAGTADPDVGGLLRPDVEPIDLMRRALSLAATVEPASGPRRRLAMTAAVAGGADFARTMAFLARPEGALAAVRDRLAITDDAAPGLDPRLVRAARDAGDPDAAAAVEDIAAALGLDLEGAPRRRGRRGRAA